MPQATIFSESVSTSTARASSLRAWFFLLWLCIVRQARLRQMVWIALALLGLVATMVALNTLQGRWTMHQWRWRWILTAPISPRDFPPRGEMIPDPERPGEYLIAPQSVILTFDGTATALELLPHAGIWPAPAAAIQVAIGQASRQLLEHSDLFTFSNWVVFLVYVGFLLPIWCVSFATEPIGGERESGNLTWLLTRPLSRSSIYLAKFLGLLPWSIGLNLGGFSLLCLLAGRPGHLALRLYWPAILISTLAFCSLFQLLSAIFRRAAVIGLVYAFFLETILGTMPGYMKRISIGFYTRCLMFDAARGYGIEPEKPSIYLPVSGTTAMIVLLGLTVALVCIGMVVFARSEYRDLN